MMNRYLIFMLLIVQEGSAQTANHGVALLHYALDSFSAGTVLLKNGTSTQQKLNYNSLTGEMIFAAGDKFLALAQPQEADTVFIGQRKFVPVANKFLEWLGGTQPALFKEYSSTVKEPAIEAGYGKSTTTAATSLSSMVQSGAAYRLKLPDEFEVVPSTAYFLRSKGKFYKFTNAQQAAKSLPAKKPAIDEWLKTRSSKFTNEAEMLRFVQAIQE
jgi:hypothetical protein